MLTVLPQFLFLPFPFDELWPILLYMAHTSGKPTQSLLLGTSFSFSLLLSLSLYLSLAETRSQGMFGKQSMNQSMDQGYGYAHRKLKLLFLRKKRTERHWERSRWLAG